MLTSTALLIAEGGEMPVWKKKGRFEVAVVEGRYASGKPKYRREAVDTEEEAYLREKELLQELKQLNASLSNNEDVQESFETVANGWLKRKKYEVAPRTQERYESIVKCHLLPAFKGRCISAIGEEDVREYFYAAKNSGTTLRQHHIILQGIFQSAEVDIMKDIKRPQKNHTEVSCIKCPNELAELVASFKDSVMFLPAYIAAVTGMRFSEIAGLRWSDVDLKQCLITVNRSLHWGRESGKKGEWYTKSTKNGSSRRTIRISNKDVDTLQRAKDERSPSKKEFVCIDGNSNPLYMNTFSSNFKKYAEKKGFDVSFHSLRHSHATILLQYYKMSINAVSRRLGHSSEMTTIGIYASALPREDEEIAETMGGIMGWV